MLPFIFTCDAQEKSLKITKMLMTSSCPIHRGYIFLQYLGVKNQAKKLKFAMRDVHTYRALQHVFLFLKMLKIVDFIITFGKNAFFKF